jgi:hypothetical protein
MKRIPKSCRAGRVWSDLDMVLRSESLDPWSFVLMCTAGLVYINEIDQSQYCDPSSTQYPCAAGQEYYGRGPLQISW